ncbi:MAG TPA: methyltransferase domain-containing protein [Actinophytocola sp.]|nr:methyltransferase domain-containing protein [Actinophytocola sp.]
MGIAPGQAAVRRDGIVVDGAEPTVIDVLFDGRWIWSFHSARDTEPDGGRRRAPWPVSLRPYLRGTSHVTVRERFSGTTLFDGDHAFDDAGTRVKIMDDQGRPLIVDKSGDLQCGFAERGQATVDTLLDAVEDVLARLTDAGVDAFLAFGALLGAVRDGTFIPHDSDADVAYLSKHRSPVDVARESFALERVMIEAGYWTWRFSAADFKVIVPDPEGGRAIDVFAGFVVEDTFYLMPEVSSADFREEIILPLGEVVLHGRKITAPADPEALLEITYGPQWRIPDPSFKFETPRQVKRRLDGWLRGNNSNRQHWWPFYFGRSSTRVSAEPSPFARWVHEREPVDTAIVDIGSGTGRDSLWFARQGHDVLGLDYIPAATERAGNIAREDDLPAQFRTFNLYDVRQVLATGGELAHRDRAPILYARFLVHALEDSGRHNLWRLANMCLRRGGKFYLEFRTGLDADAEHEFGEHFRKYLDPDAVVAEIEAGDGRIEHSETGHGLAVYKNEDPHVCRLVATWKH